MGKILDDMKAGILSADWQGVVNAYNKISGDSISYDDIKFPEELLDPNSMSKAQLYKHLSDLGYVKAPQKEFTKSDLVEIFQIHTSDTSEVAEGLSEPMPMGEDFIFRFGDPKNTLEVDKVPIKYREDPELKKVKESNKPAQKRKPPEMAQKSCVKCGAGFSEPVNKISSGVCPKCVESLAR